MCRFLFIALLLVCSLVPLQAAGSEPAGQLAAGTAWATPYYVLDTGLRGPTVVITGGVHGDEPAGALAAAAVLTWNFSRGKVVVVPRINMLGLERGQRLTPGDGGFDAVDLNRQFPREAGEIPEHPLAAGLWNLLLEVDPDWVIDLHEGERFRINEPRRYQVLELSVGNSVITPDDPRAEVLARELINHANAELPPGAVGFVLLRSFSDSRGQLYRAAHNPLGVHGLIIETVNQYQPLNRRVSQHELMLHHVFTQLDMLAED